MDVCISHVSALYWLMRNRNPRNGRELNPDDLLPIRSVCKEVADHLLYASTSIPDALMFSYRLAKAGRRSKSLMTHVCSLRVPDGSYLHVGIQSLERAWCHQSSPMSSLLRCPMRSGPFGLEMRSAPITALTATPWWGRVQARRERRCPDERRASASLCRVSALLGFPGGTAPCAC